MLSLRARRPAPSPPVAMGSSSRQAGELEARRAAGQVARGGPATGLGSVPETSGPFPSHVRSALRSPGEPLAGAVRSDLEPRFGQDFGGVRVHADERAAESAGALRARAYTTGQDIVFGRGRYDPSSSAGRTLIAHELSHVVQQRRAGREALQLDSELETFPEEERRKVQVLHSRLSEQGQKNVDQLYQEGRSLAIPAERKIQFGASVPDFKQRGLTAVVSSLTTQAQGATAAFLPRNSALTLEIPAAGAIFRFTRFDRPSTAAAGSTGPTPEVVLVEQTGLIPRPPKPIWEAFPGPFTEAQGPLPAREAREFRSCLDAGADIFTCRRIVLGQGEPANPPTPTVLKTERLRIRDVRIERGPDWKDTEWTAVSAALATLPDSALKLTAGIKFLRKPAKVCAAAKVADGTCDPKTTGENDLAKRTITLFDIAFAVSTTRYGIGTLLNEVVAHEIGHEADYRPLSAAYEQYRRTRNEAKLLAARERSGGAYVKREEKRRTVYQVTEVGGGATKGSFREAAIQDGLQVADSNKKITGSGITKYGEKSWRELFAESFSLYYNDPDLLKAIRPNVYRYLERTYPK